MLTPNVSTLKKMAKVLRSTTLSSKFDEAPTLCEVLSTTTTVSSTLNEYYTV